MISIKMKLKTFILIFICINYISCNDFLSLNQIPTQNCEENTANTIMIGMTAGLNVRRCRHGVSDLQ